MGNRYVSAAYRELGGLLRGVRERTGLTETELARRLGWPLTTVSRERKQGYYLSDERIDGSLQSLIFHESQAEHVLSYELQVIPGLLQTPDYARARIAAVHSDIAEETVARSVRTRMERRQVLYLPNTAHFTFYINEQALRLRIGTSFGVDTADDQLAAAAERYRIALACPNTLINPLSREGIHGAGRATLRCCLTCASHYEWSLRSEPSGGRLFPADKTRRIGWLIG